MVLRVLLLQLSFFPLAQLDLLSQGGHLDVTLMPHGAEVTLERVNVSVLELNAAEQTLDLAVSSYLEAAIALPMQLLKSVFKLSLFDRVQGFTRHLCQKVKSY